jgi:predicted transcriptional regulator
MSIHRREKGLKIAEICKVLDGEVVAYEAFTTPGALLLTGLANVQSVITAHVAEVKAIVYVRGKRPDADAVRLAEQKSIPLVASPLSMFTACGRLFEKGLKSGSDLGRR